MEISMACKLALKSIENEIKILNLIIDDKNDRIKELEQQLEQEKAKNTVTTEKKYVGYNIL